MKYHTKIKRELQRQGRMKSWLARILTLSRPSLSKRLAGVVEFSVWEKSVVDEQLFGKVPQE